MLRLATFGGLALIREPGAEPVTGRSRLAILVLLAAAGERGASRDKLIAWLWPERPSDSARHALEQLLYGLRRQLGADLFLGTDPLRLNPEVIASDVAEFDRALAAGDLPSAVAMYRGPFLDGFFLSDAPEFERWTETERTHLAQLYGDALYRLAQTEAGEGRHQAAITWWRKLAAAEPLNGRAALGLIRSLVAAGDRATAHQVGRQYQKTVSDELGETDASVTALLRELEAAAPTPLPDRSVISTSPTSTSPTPPTPPTPPERSIVATRVAVALALIVLGAGAVWAWRAKANGRTASSEVAPSIAVLPLDNLSTDPRDATLADGMTAELIAMLASLRSLHVVASTSVFGFRGRALDVRRIADSLRVTHLIEGGVQKVGSRLRVQLRLIDGRNGRALWSETYDRELADVFLVQDEIARSVTRQLDLQLAGPTARQRLRHTTRSVVAYENYLRGSDPTLARSDSAAQLAADYYRHAIAADSTFAAAYAGLTQVLLNRLGGDTATREIRREAESAALRAVALDDSLPEAHAALGYVRMSGGWDLPRAEPEYRRALALDPGSAVALEDLSVLLLWFGRPGEALLAARRALEADPLAARAIVAVARALYADARYDEALEALRPLASLRPPVRLYFQIAGQSYIGKENWTEAISLLRQGVELGGHGARAWLGFALARSGNREEALRIIADLRAQWQRRGGGAFNLAVVYAGLGDLDQTMAWLERAVAERWVVFEIAGPHFAAVRRDPRFEPIRSQLGLQNR